MNKKRLILSLSVLTILVASLVGATSAYFSDTETSTGNVLAAGSIDLKVDSEAHYNGLKCVGGEWTNACTPVGSDLIKNGSFENPEVENSAKWELFPNGVTGLEWTVEWESDDTTHGDATRPAPALQEYHEGVNGWAAQDGDQYAELDSDWDGPSGSLNGEPALTKIYQNVPTTPGAKYLLTYHFSPRPNTPQADNVLKVRVDGVEVDEQSLAGGAGVDWDKYTVEFVATNATTKVEFAGGGTANSLGVFLDAVSLYKLDCASTFFEYEGRECDGTWALTDLGTSNKFFNLDDVKPGDEGENTISLHVYDNDAYACMTFSNLTNTDEEMTEPEGAVDETFEAGDLAQNIMFVAWWDDGDNVFEGSTEKAIFGPEYASNALADQSYGVAVPEGNVLESGTTEYVGLAWCAGTLTIVDNALVCDGEFMGNEAQADAMSVDISFYVEQSRNNEGFVCGEKREDVLPR